MARIKKGKPKRAGQEKKRRMAARVNAKTVKDGKCFKCGKLTSADNFCYGCQTHICETCDNGCPSLGVSHKKEDHLAEMCTTCLRLVEYCAGHDDE